MKPFYKTISLTAAIIYCTALQAQVDSLQKKNCTITLKGKVLDGETRELLPGASIVIREINKGNFSNEKGEYSITSICAGTYTVECHLLGYKSVSFVSDFTKRTMRDFMLHTDTCIMESVAITVGKRQIHNTQPVVELQGKELDRTRGLSLGETLKNVPGVYTLQTGPSIFKPVIQGMYGNRVLILNNEVRQEGQQWGSEHAPEIDPFVASKISVVKGASGVRYGSDAIGGVVLIDPKELRRSPGIGGELNLAGFSNNRQGVASGIIDFGIKKIPGLSGRLQGTIKQAGNSKTPGYYLKNTGFKEQNFSWALGYNKEKCGVELFYSQFNTTLGIFSASHIGNLSDLQRAIETNVPLEISGFSYDIERPKQVVSHELSKIKSFCRFNKIGKLNLILARQYNYRAEYDKHRPYNNSLQDKPQTEFNITTHTANLILDHYSIGRLNGSIGINFIRQGNTTSGTVRSFIPNFKSYAGGIFIFERWKSQRWEFEGGIRYDYKWMQAFKYENNVLISPEFTFANFSGTIGSVYILNEHLKIHSNLGTCFRPPAVNELFSDGLHHGASRIEIGNRNLKPEVSYNINTALNYEFKSVYGSINIYNNYIKDYIYLAPSLRFDSSARAFIPDYVLTIRGAYPSFEFKQVNALFTGLDITFNDSISKKIIVSIRGSLLRAYNTTSKEYLILTPPASFETGIKYSLSISDRIKDSYIKFTNLIAARKSKVPANEDIKAPPPGYLLFNVETGFIVHAGKQPLCFTFTVNNILNTTYRDYLDRFRYFNDAIGRNFIIRLKVPFDLLNKNSKS